MINKIMAAVVGFALFSATVRLPATPCMITNTPSPQACEPGCCANKTCCITSAERTGPTTQPLTKAPSGQQNIVAIATQSGITLPIETAKEPQLFSSGETIAHSPSVLALICIRLI